MHLFNVKILRKLPKKCIAFVLSAAMSASILSSNSIDMVNADVAEPTSSIGQNEQIQEEIPNAAEQETPGAVEETPAPTQPNDGQSTAPDTAEQGVEEEKQPETVTPPATEQDGAKPEEVTPNTDAGSQKPEAAAPGNGESDKKPDVAEEKPGEEAPAEEEQETGAADEEMPQVENFEDRLNAPAFRFDPGPAEGELEIDNHRYVTSIDLIDHYKPSASFSNGDGHILAYYPQRANFPEMHNPAEIGKNYFALGTKDCRVPGKNQDGEKQVVATTSTFELNYRRPFIIKGQVKLTHPDNADGFAIAFHNDRDFSVENTGGSLGLYYHRDNANGNARGVSCATVMEIDTWYNRDAEDAYAEPRNYQGHHMAIVETAEEGDANANPNQNVCEKRNGLLDYTPIRNTNMFTQLTDFTVEWIPYQKLVFTYGVGYKVEVPYQKLKYLSAITEGKYANGEVQTGRGLVTFAASVNMKKAQDSIYLKLTEMRYTDVQPRITVEPYTAAPEKQDLDTSKPVRYVMPGERFGVMSELENEKETHEKIDEYLYLNLLKPDWNQQASAVLPREGRISFWDEEKKWYTYPQDNMDFPMYVHFRSKVHTAGVAKYRYDVRPDQNLKNGEHGYIKYQYKSGVLGMTQIVHEGEIPVRARNAIESNNKTDFDFIRVDNTADITEDSMWDGIRAKSSDFNNNAWVTLDRRTPNVQGMTVKYEYFVDGKSHGTTFPTITAEDRCKVYSLKVTITDDNNDDRLTNSVTKVMYAADYAEQKDGILILADNSKAEIIETKLNVRDPELFKEEVIQNTGAKAFTYSVNEGIGEAQKLSVDFKDTTKGNTPWMNNRGKLDQNVGKHYIKVYVESKPSVAIYPQQTVTINSWSYDDGHNNDITEGVPGYIIIPSGIGLERGKDAIEGTAKVKYVGYDSDKRYEVETDRTITLNSRLDAQAHFQVEVTGESVNGDKTFVGTLSKDVTEKTITLRSINDAMEVTKNKDTWIGSLTFYIKQANP